jgi:hypothetical protein
MNPAAKFWTSSKVVMPYGPPPVVRGARRPGCSPLGPRPDRRPSPCCAPGRHTGPHHLRPEREAVPRPPSRRTGAPHAARGKGGAAMEGPSAAHDLAGSRPSRVQQSLRPIRPRRAKHQPGWRALSDQDGGSALADTPSPHHHGQDGPGTEVPKAEARRRARRPKPERHPAPLRSHRQISPPDPAKAFEYSQPQARRPPGPRH